MISGKKPFVQGKPFKFPKFKKASDNRKGKACTNCGRYKKNEHFLGNSNKCKTCEK